MYKKIVVVVDSFGEPKNPLNEAIKLAKEDKSELHLLIQKPEMEDLVASAGYMPAYGDYEGENFLPYNYDEIDKTDKEYQKDVDNVIANVKSSGVENLVTGIFSTSPKTFVQKYAKKHDVDLVVLGGPDDLMGKWELDSLFKHLIRDTKSNIVVIR